jgi:hypothetical protein
MSDLDFPGEVNVDAQSLARNGYGPVRFGRDKYDGKIIQFYWRQVHNPSKSREAGIQMFDKEMFVKIFTPGERLEEIDRPVRENDKYEFPRQWAAFEQNRMYVPEGTPIEVLFPADPQIPAMLRGVGVHTVQQCSRMTAHAIETLGMGAQDWANKAAKMLSDAKEHRDDHVIEQLQENHKHEINALKNQIAELIHRLGQMQSSVAQHAPAFAIAQLEHERAVEAINSARVNKAPATPEWPEAKPGFIAPEPEELPKLDMRTKEGRAIKAAKEGGVTFTKE